MITNDEISFNEDELKELFELFSSCSDYELRRVYDAAGDSYYAHVDLSDEYELTQEKREFAFDAIRAVLYFLSRRGYRLEKDSAVVALDSIRKWFV